MNCQEYVGNLNKKAPKPNAGNVKVKGQSE